MAETADKLEQAMRLAGRARHMLLATVDQQGTPRLTPVEACTRAGDDRVAIEAWIDVPPQENRGGRSRVALLLWDERGRGFQLAGHALSTREAAVLDGLAEIEMEVHFPQVERNVLMQVESIEEFRFADTRAQFP